jgi:acetyl-CoA acetyltransferase
MAQLYMKKYGVTEDDYALVSIKNHECYEKLQAQFHKKASIEDSRIRDRYHRQLGYSITVPSIMGLQH